MNMSYKFFMILLSISLCITACATEPEATSIVSAPTLAPTETPTNILVEPTLPPTATPIEVTPTELPTEVPTATTAPDTPTPTATIAQSGPVDVEIEFLEDPDATVALPTPLSTSTPVASSNQSQVQSTGGVNSDTGCTYYVSTTGNDDNVGTSLDTAWRTISLAAELLVAGETVCVQPGTYVEHVEPVNSGNETDGYITYLATEPGQVIIDGQNELPDSGQPVSDGLFDLVDNNYIIIDGFVLKNSLAGGIYVGGETGSSNIIIRNNSTDTTWSSGIGVWYSQFIEVYNNEIQQANYGEKLFDGQPAKEQEMLTIAETSDFVVHHNYVHNGVTISEEIIGGAEGIDIKQGSQRGQIYNNRIEALPENLGIYIDTYGPTSDLDIYNNFIDCRHPEQNGVQGIILSAESEDPLSNVNVYNNIVVHCRDDGIVFPNWTVGQISNVNILHNTVLYNGNADAGWGGGISVQTENVTGITIGNNIISGNNNWQLLIPDARADEIVVANNLIHGANEYVTEGMQSTFGVEAITEAPLFEAVAQNDFQLLPESPGVGAGLATLPVDVTFDFDDEPRTGADIGAFEVP